MDLERTSSIDWTQLSRLLPEDGDRIQSPKHCVLRKKKKRKKKMMDDVQKQ
jgi:hypothetical protein